MGNGSGSYSITTKRQMEAFDKLPPTLREALRNAAFDWATGPILARFNKGTKSARWWAAEIEKWDAQHIARDRKRVWGITDDGARPARTRRPVR